MRILDGRTLSYGSRSFIWINRLVSECPGADPLDTLLIEPTSSQYCQGDRVRVIEPTRGVPGPFCALGDFVPYRR